MVFAVLCSTDICALGGEVRTPAMQAGLAARKLSLRAIFTARLAPSRFVVARSASVEYHEVERETRWAAWQQPMNEAPRVPYYRLRSWFEHL